MIFIEVVQDLFTVDKDFYLAHCIAADYGMGAGIAVPIAKKYHLRNSLKTNFPNPEVGSCKLYNKVFNLITKQRSSGKPYYNTLTSSILDMKAQAIELGIKKIAMPKIGCGLDRLQWVHVREIIQLLFEDTDIEILVCIW